jgi:hypothetical protein
MERVLTALILAVLAVALFVILFALVALAPLAVLAVALFVILFVLVALARFVTVPGFDHPIDVVACSEFADPEHVTRRDGS